MNNFSKTQSITLTGMFGAIIFVLTFTGFAFPQIPLIGSATIIHIPVIIGAILMGPKYGAVLGFMFGLSSMIFASTYSVALNAFAFTPLRPVPGTDSGSLWALVIAFVPRILVGIVPPLVFYAIRNLFQNKWTSVKVAIAALAGSLTNTLLVLHLLFFIFREPWSLARENAAAAARANAEEALANAAAEWESARDAIVTAGADYWEHAAEFARNAVGYEHAATAAEGMIIASPQITYGFITGTIVGFGIPEAIAAAVLAPAVCIPLFLISRRRRQAQD